MTVAGVVAFVSECMTARLDAQLDGGLFGFTERWRLRAILDDGARVEIGAVARGGESQKGRWLLQLTGKGCGLVDDWPSLQSFLEDLGAEVSRVDLAVDFLHGEHTVDDVLSLYEQGAFTSRGRTPDLDIQGAWHQSGVKGRTVYVGKLKNGKTLCVYEKGRQLEDYTSDWTRYEVRLGNRDRTIPLDVLTNPDRYFVGAYPALAGMLEAAAQEVPTCKAETQATLAHLTYHAKRCYGKAFNQVMQSSGCSAADLVEELRVIGVPKRLDPGNPAGLYWPELQAEIRRKAA